MNDKEKLLMTFDLLGIPYEVEQNFVLLNDGYDENFVAFTFDEYGKFYELTDGEKAGAK